MINIIINYYNVYFLIIFFIYRDIHAFILIFIVNTQQLQEQCGIAMGVFSTNNKRELLEK